MSWRTSLRDSGSCARSDGLVGGAQVRRHEGTGRKVEEHQAGTPEGGLGLVEVA